MLGQEQRQRARRLSRLPRPGQDPLALGRLWPSAAFFSPRQRAQEPTAHGQHAQPSPRHGRRADAPGGGAGRLKRGQAQAALALLDSADEQKSEQSERPER